MIRIESNLLHVMHVPLEPDLGNRSPTLCIPAANAKGPGILEVESLPAKVIARLKWSYERRPIDHDAGNAEEFDKNGNARFFEIGLLKITEVGDDAAAVRKATAGTKKRATKKGPRHADDLDLVTDVAELRVGIRTWQRGYDAAVEQIEFLNQSVKAHERRYSELRDAMATVIALAEIPGDLNERRGARGI